MGQVAAAQRCTARAVKFCSKPYRRNQTKLRDPRRLCGLMQVPQKVQRTIDQPEQFDSTTIKHLEDFYCLRFLENIC